MSIETNVNRKFVGNYVACLTHKHGSEFSCSRVNVVNAAPITVDPVGFPIIWDSENDGYKLLSNDDDLTAIANTGGGSLPDGSVVGIVVGSREGFGTNTCDVEITPAGVEMTVAFRGPGTVVADRLEYAGTDVNGDATVATPAGEELQKAFAAQLEKQSLAVVASAPIVTPTYTS